MALTAGLREAVGHRRPLLGELAPPRLRAQQPTQGHIVIEAPIDGSVTRFPEIRSYVVEPYERDWAEYVVRQARLDVDQAGTPE